jgi:alpha-D-xyloside xylohydrolase
MMRPLVMDFNGDTSALNQPYEFMFGKALLVAPVTEPEVNQIKVYLPSSPVWYDFWTGERYAGGQAIQAAAPLDKIPLFVKAGSIIPMGKFIHYEDENDNYNYERGEYSTIDFRWDESAQTLTIGRRRGRFPGMSKIKIFEVVFVSGAQGTGIVKYNGSERKVTVR